MKSKSNYDACIFDLDGTLTDTLEDLKNALNYSLRSMGFPERSLDEVRRFVGNGAENLIKRSLPENADDGDFLLTLNIYRDYYSVHYNDATAPYEGILPMLEKLKSMNIKAAVVSNKDDNNVKSVVDSFFGGLVEISQGKKEGIPPKPSPESLNGIISVLGCEHAVYIGDSDVDVETAHNAELECIGVSWGFRGREVLEKSGADYVIDNPAEIFTII